MSKAEKSAREWAAWARELFADIKRELGMPEKAGLLAIIPAIKKLKEATMGNGTENDEDRRPAKLCAPTENELHKRFFFHRPRDDEAVRRHELVSALTFELACKLCTICPPGRNLALALTALEEVRMRANAAIAVDDPRP